MPFTMNVARFLEIGTTPIISDPNVITLSDDKWELYKFLQLNRFPHIQSALSIDEAKAKGIKLPWILKPKAGGCRSKNVFQCNKESEAKCLVDSGDEYIIQEFIDGDEYTCGSVTFEKQVLGTIQMRRTLRNGDTYKAFVEGVPPITVLLDKLLPKIDPFGPCNVQLRMRGNVPYILEINARCSGTTAARALAGFNEPLMICNHLLNRKVSHDIKDVAIFRYWNEVVVDKREKEHLERENTTHGI
jgi:carbamoyl-phosphate synthase large subunit